MTQTRRGRKRAEPRRQETDRGDALDPGDRAGGRRWRAAAVHGRRPYRRDPRQRRGALLLPAQRPGRDPPLCARRVARGRQPRRLDLRARSPARGRPAREHAAGQQFPDQRGRREPHPDRRRHRHHAAESDDAPARGARRELHAALLRARPRTRGLPRRADRLARGAAAPASRRRRSRRAGSTSRRCCRSALPPRMCMCAGRRA